MAVIDLWFATFAFWTFKKSQKKKKNRNEKKKNNKNCAPASVC